MHSLIVLSRRRGLLKEAFEYLRVSSLNQLLVLRIVIELAAWLSLMRKLLKVGVLRLLLIRAAVNRLLQFMIIEALEGLLSVSIGRTATTSVVAPAEVSLEVAVAIVRISSEVATGASASVSEICVVSKTPTSTVVSETTS